MVKYVCGIDPFTSDESKSSVVVKNLKTNTYVKYFDSIKKFRRWLWWKRLFGVKVVIMSETNSFLT